LPSRVRLGLKALIWIGWTLLGVAAYGLLTVSHYGFNLAVVALLAYTGIGISVSAKLNLPIYYAPLWIINIRRLLAARVDQTGKQSRKKR
jgi:hypothetical protein